MSVDFDNIKSQYMKFSDKSDFIPVVMDDNNIKFYYSDDIGLQKAKFMSLKEALIRLFDDEKYLEDNNKPLVEIIKK